jgi:conjugative relaxase-like TrwC/TraI family protein
VRFTVTPLGGARSDVGRAVNGIVRYLQPPELAAQTPDGPARDGIEGPSRYYADRGEELGRWLGRAAAGAGLSGEVRRDDFAAVLSGRDPHTGERLITAQGSAGRRPKLGAGAPTRMSIDGETLYGESDAAAGLGVTKAEAARMLDVGTSVALTQAPDGRANGRASGRVSVFRQVSGSYLVPVVEADGSRWVTGAELARCEAARAAVVDPGEIRALGPGDDQLPIGEAARLAGLTNRYMRNVAKHHENHRTEIERTVEAGRQPRKAYLVAHRGTRGQWLVTRQHLAEFLERRRPPSVRVGFDLTLTTEKSLGVLALLGDTYTSRAVLRSIQDGNDWAMAWLEDHAAYGRVGGEPVKAAGWMTASFRHLTSRALDPFPHHHNVVANTVALPDGTHRGLDARGLYRHAQAASGLATAEMRYQLSLRLGVRWRPGRKTGWEIAGIDDRVIAAFSQRRSEMDDLLRELEVEIGRGVHPRDVDRISLRTRPAKRHAAAATLVDEWRQRAAALGLDAKAIETLCEHTLMIEMPDPAVVFASLAGPDGICAGGSIFSRTEALVALANHRVSVRYGEPQPLLVGAARLEEMVDEFLASQHVLQVTRTVEPLFTTTEMLGVQDRIVTRFTKGLHRGASLVPDDYVAAAIAKHSYLTIEQRTLVQAWCGQGHKYQAAIGRAGAGKTTTVAACADAWTAAGYRVVGTAVKGEAARTLAAGTGIECETVAWYLAHDDPQNLPLDARTILVVDEASTVSDRDLDALMGMAATTGASIRLIGDPAQHGAIAAGGMFRVLCERHHAHTLELTATHRVLDPDDRAAAQALREGRIDDALDRLEAAGHLHVVGDDLTMYRHVLGRWWDAHRDGQDHPMVDRRNSTRRELNRLAHRLRQVNGEISSAEIVASGDRRFSVGDRITARTPNRRLHAEGDRKAYVRNGALGTVIEIRPDQTSRQQDTLVVAFDGIGTIELPRSFFDDHRTTGGRTEVGIDHAYALTSYAVQGSTRDVSTSRVDPTTSRAETYVDITRGRYANHLYLTNTADSLEGEGLPRIPAAPADQSVADRLQHSLTELTAWELAHPKDAPAPHRRGRAIGF